MLHVTCMSLAGLHAAHSVSCRACLCHLLVQAASHLATLAAMRMIVPAALAFAVMAPVSAVISFQGSCSLLVDRNGIMLCVPQCACQLHLHKPCHYQRCAHVLQLSSNVTVNCRACLCLLPVQAAVSLSLAAATVMSVALACAKIVHVG
jgi:hypothetical protein